jgi:integrase
MASRSTRPNGDTWIFVKAANGKRRPVRLGNQSEDNAAEAKRRLAKIEAAFQGRDELDRLTRTWVEHLPPVLRDRVAQTGLLPADLAQPVTQVACYPLPQAAPPTQDCSLARLLDRWRSTLTVEARTTVIYGQHIDRLERFAAWLQEQPGEGRNPVDDIRHIVPADAKRFEAWLQEHGSKQKRPLSPSTASRTIGTVQTIFQFATLEGWRPDNPFGHLSRRGEFNEERNVYVTPELVDHLIADCGDPELRAMLAICRYAGLRGPSEFAPLCWADVDWEGRWLTVTSPKTKRYRFGRRRRTPLCDKCVAQLESLYEATPAGTEKLFPRLGLLDSSPLSDRIEVLCRRAGVPLWDKPWTNMRACCETDWQAVEKMQPFETAAYMGHSPTVALAHYNRVAKDRIADLPEIRKGEAKHASGEGPRRSTKRSAQIRSNVRSVPLTSAQFRSP